MTLAWDGRDPSDVDAYVINWTDALPSSETISTSAWTISPSGGTTPLTKDSQDLTGANLKTRIWLSGGVNGVIYTITNTIVTSNSRTLQRSVQLTCSNDL